MRMGTFARRNFREILRDPLTLLFGLGFPLILLGLLSAIQRNIPVPLFEIAHLTPGICIFGLSFLTLFSAMVVARDREGAFLHRLYATPMRASDFLGGYILPMLPLGLGQGTLCFGAGMLLGLSWSWKLLWALVLLIPSALVFVSLGLLCGSLLNTKQVGGICGALVTNLCAWLSGIWFDLDLVGGAFRTAAECLPFYHAVELERAAVSGGPWLTHFLWVCVYAVVLWLCAVLAFLRQMENH